MPGPSNSKKKSKQQQEKQKNRLKRTSLLVKDQSVAESREAQLPGEEEHARLPSPSSRSENLSPQNREPGDKYQGKHGSREVRPDIISGDHSAYSSNVSSPPSLLDYPFIVDPGNGPRVKDANAFFSSFFCPPPSLDDVTCASFTKPEVLSVLETVLPREIALIIWFNKTRKFGRICPACQRLYRLGDALADPITSQPIDVYDPQTSPRVLREQQISGICSSPCFLLASYTSRPYVADVARGAWGLQFEELDAQTRSLLDATDPGTAAFLRYGRAALQSASQGWDETARMDDLGLGRAMRMTRWPDLGLGELLYKDQTGFEQSPGYDITAAGRRSVGEVINTMARAEEMGVGLVSPLATRKELHMRI